MLALLYSFSLLATQTVESACMLRRARLIRSDRPSRHLSIWISRNRVSICLECSLYVRMALPRPVIRLLPFLSYRHLLSFFLGPLLPPLLLDALSLRSRTPPAVKTLASNFEHHPVLEGPIEGRVPGAFTKAFAAAEPADCRRGFSRVSNWNPEALKSADADKWVVAALAEMRRMIVMGHGCWCNFLPVRGGLVCGGCLRTDQLMAVA